MSLAATLGHRWALVAFDSENSAIKFHALAAPQRGTRTKRARPPNRLVAASVIGFDGPGRVGRPIDAKAALLAELRGDDDGDLDATQSEAAEARAAAEFL